MAQLHPGDQRALDRFEVFLFSAVITVVLVRAFLIVTGYPKVGGSGLHIAHVLWGGLLMAIAIAIVLIDQGTRSRMRAARLGGVGFGLFIDEVGKFVTKNVNYFFRPAIAIIYITFVGFYLVVRELLLRRTITDRQRLAVASTALTDLSLGQLTEAGRQNALALLTDVRSHPQLTAAVREGLQAETPRGAAHERRITQLRNRCIALVRAVIERPQFHRNLAVVFALQAVVIGGELVLLLIHPAAGSSKGSDVTTYGAESTAGVSGAYLLFGWFRLTRHDHAGALRVLFRSVLVTAFVTQIFVFAEYQASGIIGLVFELGVYALIRLAAEAQPAMFRPPRAAEVPAPRPGHISRTAATGSRGSGIPPASGSM